jgi:TRAP-type C4-dicarboxylate transport system permease small subunit
MASFERIINSTVTFLFQISKICVFALMVLVVMNIILRKAWHSIYGTYDYVGFITTIMVTFGIGYLAYKKGHIAVDLLVERFPRRVQAIIDGIGSILSFGIFALISWQLIIYGNGVLKSGEHTLTSMTPFYPFVYGISLGMALLCLVLLVDFIKCLTKAVKG